MKYVSVSTCNVSKVYFSSSSDNMLRNVVVKVPDNITYHTFVKIVNE